MRSKHTFYCCLWFQKISPRSPGASRFLRSEPKNWLNTMPQKTPDSLLKFLFKIFKIWQPSKTKVKTSGSTFKPLKNLIKKKKQTWQFLHNITFPSINSSSGCFKYCHFRLSRKSLVMNLIGFSLLSILAIHQSFSCILVPGQSDACGHIDVVQGISVYDVKGLWYLQNIFFTNLLPPNATKGVHVIMNPINCSTIKEETVYLDPADYEHHYPVFLKLIQGLNVAQQYQRKSSKIFSKIEF